MNEFATLPRDENRDDLQVCTQQSFNAFKKVFVELSNENINFHIQFSLLKSL